jgi:hypothetical protein
VKVELEIEVPEVTEQVTQVTVWCGSTRLAVGPRTLNIAFDWGIVPDPTGLHGEGQISAVEREMRGDQATMVAFAKEVVRRIETLRLSHVALDDQRWAEAAANG